MARRKNAVLEENGKELRAINDYVEQTLSELGIETALVISIQTQDINGGPLIEVAYIFGAEGGMNTIINGVNYYTDSVVEQDKVPYKRKKIVLDTDYTNFVIDNWYETVEELYNDLIKYIGAKNG